MRLWWLSLPLLASAFHNITYVSNDPALVYTPVNTWQDWPPNGCLNFPIGQWSKVPGTITLKFSGVAVFAYGLFDDDTNPIYTIQVDDGSPVRLGDYTSTNCELFSKTGLRAGNHTIVFHLTGEKPGDVKDLSFQGFIVTVPDVGDDVTPAANNTTTRRKSNTAIIAAAVAIGVAALVGVILGIWFWRSRRNRNQKGQPIGVPPPSSFGNQPPVTTQYNPGYDPNIPQPTPFFVPPRENSPQNNAGQPWATPPPGEGPSHPNSPYNQPGQNGYFPPAPNAMPAEPGYPNYYGPSPSNAGSSSGYGAPNSPPPFQQQGGAKNPYNYEPPPPTSPAPTSAYMAATSEVSYTQMSDVTQSSSGYKPPIDTKASPFAKGAVNPNATPVHRADGPSGGAPAPPQYDAPF